MGNFTFQTTKADTAIPLRVLSAPITIFLLLWVIACAGGLPPNLALESGLPSNQTYRVHVLSDCGIRLDGRIDETAWARSDVETRFLFPWNKTAAPPTEFRALCDGANFYFMYRVQDADVVALDKLSDEEDAVFEDRVEMILARDDGMKDYYCMEIDSRGRTLDYRAAYYRQFDFKWNWPGLETRAQRDARGYAIEGRIPLDALEGMGFPRLRPGARIRCGLFRAEFSHDRSGRPYARKSSIHTQGRTIEGPPPLEDWISWVDPKTKEPDFHVPSALGWLEFVN